MEEMFDLNDPGKQESTTAAEVSEVNQPATSPEIPGLSPAEIMNPNAIVVTVSDTKTPIVVLFGARTSGKTMTLIRLTRYLNGLGYNVVPDPIFRPDSDRHYQRICAEFDRLVNSDYAPSGTDVMSFMLVKVIDKNGRTLCQILEAPGEHYFDPVMPKNQFPAYINRICSIPNRKTWMFIVEENWGGSQEVRNLYAKKIMDMQQKTRPSDKIIFACNKVDESNCFLPTGRPNREQIFQNIEFQFPNIFSRYKERMPVISWLSPYNFDFVTFSAGSFNDAGNGKQLYTPGEDFYPEELWHAIKKNI